jgi:hypothetical protein
VLSYEGIANGALSMVQLSWVSASHRDKAQDAFIYVKQRPAGPDFKLLSFLSVGTKQQSRLKYSQSLMSIPFGPHQAL